MGQQEPAEDSYSYLAFFCNWQHTAPTSSLDKLKALREAQV